MIYVCKGNTINQRRLTSSACKLKPVTLMLSLQKHRATMYLALILIDSEARLAENGCVFVRSFRNTEETCIQFDTTDILITRAAFVQIKGNLSLNPTSFCFANAFRRALGNSKSRRSLQVQNHFYSSRHLFFLFTILQI